MEQYIPKNACIPEHVLAFQIAAGAPPAHHNHQLILSLHNESGNIEFCHIVAALAVSGIIPHIHRMCLLRKLYDYRVSGMVKGVGLFGYIGAA